MDVNSTENNNDTITTSSIPIKSDCALFCFVITGVFLGFIAVLGIFGNIITMIILSRPQMRSSINCILIGLARCDTALLITAVLMFTLPSIHKYTGYLETYSYEVFPLVGPILYPIGLIAQTGSVYLTLTVTLERYVAVCHPLRARSLCTYGRARVYVIVIIIFAALYNLPRFFEAARIVETIPGTNTTVYVITASTLRKNQYYITIYVNWSYLVVMYIIPFTCLALFNTAIYRQVRKANAERQRLSRLQRKEIGLATMLLCVVIVFFMCNVLALVNNVLESLNGVLKDELVATSNLFVVINSSVNFVIYVIFGEKFKRLFLKIFCQYSVNGGQYPQVAQSTACCIGGASGGRDSPDATHDDSFVSNGNGRSYSVRGGAGMTQSSCRHHRTMSSSLRPTEDGLFGGNRLITPPSSVQLQLVNLNSAASVSRAPVPCVYYPSNNAITSSSLNNAAASTNNGNTSILEESSSIQINNGCNNKLVCKKS